MSNWTAAASPDEPFDHIALLKLVYLTLFLLGFAGNSVVIISVVRTLLQRKPKRNSTMANPASDHLRIYILALSTVDLCVISVIPIIVTDLHFGQWMLGRILCKYYWAMENISKLASIALLAVLSVDRYFAIRYPFHYCWVRKRRTIAVVLLCCAAVAVVSLLPLLIYADVQNMTVWFELGSITYNVSVHKCAVDQGVSDTLQTGFTSYAFALGYCLPFCVMLVSYGKLLCYVKSAYSTSIARPRPSGCNRSRYCAERTNATPLVNNSITSLETIIDDTRRPVRATTISVLRVTAFHLICWTPYWTVTLYLLFKRGGQSAQVPVLLMFVHSLPFASSAGNWIFYALLNRELRGSMTLTVSSRCSRTRQRQKLQIPVSLYSYRDQFAYTSSPLQMQQRRKAVCRVNSAPNLS